MMSIISNKNQEGKIDYQAILIFLFLFSVFLLALCKIEDTDAWMHLNFGKLIWHLKGFPDREPFLYTMLDKPFIYSSWLFGLIYYLSYLAFNIYGVILLKAFTVTTAFYILLKDSLRPYKNYFVSIIILTVIVILSRHRFVERPDTFLMVFLSFSIYSLNAFIYENKKYIYALPLIHMLWANSHSSIDLMFVPFLSFIVGGAIQRYISSRFTVHGSRFIVNSELFSNTPSVSQLKTILVIFVCSFAASLISPYFISQYTFGFQFLASDWFKQEIIELQPPTWKTYKGPYLVTAAVALSFILNWFTFYRLQFRASNPPESPYTPLWKRGAEEDFKGGPGGLSLIHLFLIMPFIYLSFTALRFIFLLAIVSGPILSRNLSAFLKNGKERLWNKFEPAIIALWILAALTLTLMNIEPLANKEKIFGFGISYNNIPEGALRYMDKRGITGRVFNTFQWGQYITWRDFPKRSAFIDGRGYVSTDLLEKLDLARCRQSLLDELHKKYGFESILVTYPAFVNNISERDMSLSHPGWALVYWDDLSLLYLRRGGRYDSIIKDDEYRFIKPSNGIYGIDISKMSGIIEELKRNISETNSSMAYVFLGYVYYDIGLYREAIDAFSKVRESLIINDLSQAKYSGLGYSYDKLGNTDEAIVYFKKALALEKNATVLFDIGRAYIKQGKKKEAIRYLKRALDLNKNLTSVYPLLTGLYQELGMLEDAEKTKNMYESAKILKERDEHFKSGVRAYFEHRFETAVEEFKKSIEIYPSNPVSYSNIGYIYFDMGDLERSYEYQKRALGIDPNLANAYYGLALIYKKWGNLEMAKSHWEEYLRIEPKGYYSRKAKEEIEKIK